MIGLPPRNGCERLTLSEGYSSQPRVNEHQDVRNCVVVFIVEGTHVRSGAASLLAMPRAHLITV